MPILQWSIYARQTGPRISFSRLLQSTNRFTPYRHRPDLYFSLNHAKRIQPRTNWSDMSQPSCSKVRPIWIKYKERSIRKKEERQRALGQADESADRPPKKQKRQSTETIPSPKLKDRKSRIDLKLNEECLQLIQQTLFDAERHTCLQSDDNEPVQVGNRSTETEQLRRWYDRRLDPVKAEERSSEMQLQVR